MAGTALASAPLDGPNCSDLGLQDAQAALDTLDPAERLRLDDLCEAIPVVRSDDSEEADDATPDTTPAAAPDEDNDDDKKADKKDEGRNDDGDEDDNAAGDRDCSDFDSQADAQAAFEESSNDEERLDADDDGIACKDAFGTEDQQVAVYPEGGVATGGAALS
ncbi:excalibur calcium-binding domain-containing protein [Pseudonocardia sp. DSM 110487]|nr:excalibur calcium-binding domain-containing protein [Pseudonocardia sp. DSM 110487]